MAPMGKWPWIVPVVDEFWRPQSSMSAFNGHGPTHVAPISKWPWRCTSAVQTSKFLRTQGLYSLFGKTSYGKISTYRSHKVRVKTFSIALKLERNLGSSIAKMPLECLSDTIIKIADLAAPTLHEICRKTSYRLVNRGPAEASLLRDEDA